MAASVTNVSHREGVHACLRTAPPLARTLGVYQTSWGIPFRRHAGGVVLVLRCQGGWVSHTPPPVPKQRRP